MAGSRYEKIGTIFSRTTGMLRSGAMKEADKPLWYDVYKAFPPKYEPRVDRPVPTNEIPQILYPEDKIRAKFYKMFGSPGMVDMNNSLTKSLCQRFINKYLELEQTEKFVTDDETFDATIEHMNNLGINLSKPQLKPQPKILEKVEPIKVNVFNEDTKNKRT